MDFCHKPSIGQLQTSVVRTPAFKKSKKIQGYAVCRQYAETFPTYYEKNFVYCQLFTDTAPCK